MFDPNVTGLMFFDKAPKLDVIAEAFEKYVWTSHRFHSCMENGYWVVRHDKMDRSYHFREEIVKDEEEIQKLALREQLSSLDPAYPRWRIFVFRAQQSGKSAVCFNAHHAIGDGLGILFAFAPLMGVESGNPLAHIPLPTTILPPSAQKLRRAASKAVLNDWKVATEPKRGLFARLLMLLHGWFIKSVRSFLRGAFTPLLIKPDSELSINMPLAKRDPLLPFSGSRTYARFPAVSMDAVKAVRAKYDCSVNDALMAALAGALRRYAIEIAGDKRLKEGGPAVECKSLAMIALPREVDESDLTTALCNKILFATTWLPIDEPTAAGRMARTISGCNDLKSKAYMTGLIGFTRFITNIAPRKLLDKAAGETWSKHTLCVTNVPAPSVPMRFPAEGGEEVKEVACVIANVMPQVSIVSYNGYIYAGIVADPQLIADTAALGEMWVEEFGILAA